MAEAAALNADRASTAASAPAKRQSSLLSSIVRIGVVGACCLLANYSSFGAGLALGLLLSNGLWLLHLDFEPYEGYEDLLLNAEFDTETTTGASRTGILQLIAQPGATLAYGPRPIASPQRVKTSRARCRRRQAWRRGSGCWTSRTGRAIRCCCGSRRASSSR